jgi:hypothetical protein
MNILKRWVSSVIEASVIFHNLYPQSSANTVINNGIANFKLLLQPLADTVL